MSLTHYTLEEKLRTLKLCMNDGSWYVSEKIRIEDTMKKIGFDISTALSLLFKKGYLDRKDSKRIYFNTKRIPKTRRYYGKFAYRFKPEYLIQNHKQLKLNYGNSETKTTRGC